MIKKIQYNIMCTEYIISLTYLFGKANFVMLIHKCLLPPVLLPLQTAVSDSMCGGYRTPQNDSTQTRPSIPPHRHPGRGSHRIRQCRAVWSVQGSSTGQVHQGQWVPRCAPTKRHLLAGREGVVATDGASLWPC